MDEEIKKLVKQVIREDLGDIVAEVVREQFEPIKKQIQIIQDTNDKVVKLFTDQGWDIDAIKISAGKQEKQNQAIIENQKTQGDKVVEAVRTATKETTKETVETIFKNKPFLQRLKERFRR